MKRNFKQIFFVSFAVFASAFSLPLTAQVLIGLRGDEQNVQELKSKYKLSVLKTKAQEFEKGGSSEVKFLEPVGDRDVLINLPAQMSPDQLMEALIAVRTAQAEKVGPIKVMVTSSQKLDDIKIYDSEKKVIPVDLKQLFSVVGADKFLKQDDHYTFTAQEKIVKVPTSHPAVQSQDFIILSSDSHPELGKEVAQELGKDTQKASDLLQEMEKNTEAVSLSHKQVYFVAPSPHPRNENFFTNLSQIQKLKKLGANVHLISPYLIYARSDKAKDGVIATGKLAADLIEGSGTDAISVIRAHAPQSVQGFTIPIKDLEDRDLAIEYFKEIGVDMIIAPDAGAQKEDTLYADMLDKPIGVINKQRDPIDPTKIVLKDISGESVEGKVVVIIDDETASGSTLDNAAKLVKEKGAKMVYAFVTHLAGSGDKAINSKYIDQLIVTNTLPFPNKEGPKFKILSVKKILAKHIRQKESQRFALLQPVHPEGSCGQGIEKSETSALSPFLSLAEILQSLPDQEKAME